MREIAHDAADQLAERTLAYWQDQAVRRRIVPPALARVRWRWAPPDLAAPHADLMAPPLPGLGGDGETLSGVVTQLHDEVYLRLRHRRLVILGEPGAGKTAVMILLRMGHRRDLAWWLIPSWVPGWQIVLVGGLWGGLVGVLVGGLVGGLAGVLMDALSGALAWGSSPGCLAVPSAAAWLRR